MSVCFLREAEERTLNTFDKCFVPSFKVRAPSKEVNCILIFTSFVCGYLLLPLIFLHFDVLTSGRLIVRLKQFLQHMRPGKSHDCPYSTHMLAQNF